jgi:hypothetical protein
MIDSRHFHARHDYRSWHTMAQRHKRFLFILPVRGLARAVLPGAVMNQGKTWLILGAVMGVSRLRSRACRRPSRR